LCDKRVIAVRGATTLEADDRQHVVRRIEELIHLMVHRNGIEEEDMISVIVTATPDVKSIHPATAARLAGLSRVPLLGAQELPVPEGVPLCVRVLVHAYSARPRSEVAHVYLHGAAALRPEFAVDPTEADRAR
jgi:chorismate mutase